MALTPESVASKTFTETHFQKGYAQGEVDDFLDDVVSEIKRLADENEDLREQLAAAERRAGEGASSTAGTDPVPASVDEPSAEGVAPVAGSTSGAGGSTPAVPVQASAPEDAPALEQAPAEEPTGSAGSAAGVLALAQRLHDEHVRAGEDERDRLVDDARTEAGRLLTQAQDTERSTLESLEERRTTELGALERERSLLERKVDELRGFEREYRSRLRSYLQSQLSDLDGTAAVVPGADGASATGGRS